MEFSRMIEVKNSDSPFFLNYHSRHKHKIWYIPCPLGKKKIGKILDNAFKLQKNDNNKSCSKRSNHSTCKYMISKLHPIHISQLSGHKNINSLKSYHSASIEKQQEMSQILFNDYFSNLPNSLSLLYSSNALPNSGCLFHNP